MTKQEKIIEAYGDSWNIAKNFADENGWIDRYKQSAYLNIGEWGKDKTPIKNFLGKNDYFGLESKNDKYRPKSLHGIETNNGWIKIESEDDLKVKEGYYAVFNTRWKNDEISIIQIIEPYKLDSTITHYQPIIKPQPPIY